MSEARAGGHDWLAIWRQMYDAERAQGEAATDAAFGRDSDPWAARSARFAAASQRATQPDSFMQHVLPDLRADDTVLDVGAGSGRYLPLLAATVRSVIAVEPSAAMRAELNRVVAAHGLRNVLVHAESWPLAEPIAADIVLSAHVVYGVREVGPFLQAMDRAARRTCYLYLGVKPPAAALAPFWAHVHGEARLPLPAALEALCCLHQLGLYASMELVPTPGSFRFTSKADAIEEIRHRLRLSPDPARDSLIAAAVDELLDQTGNGDLAPRGSERQAAVLSWQPATNAATAS